MVRRHISHSTITELPRRYYSRNGPDLAVFTVSIDGSAPQRVNATSRLGVNQSMLWSNKSLGVGKHNVTFTHDDENGKYFGLDFFRLVTSDVRPRGRIPDLPSLLLLAPFDRTVSFTRKTRLHCNQLPLHRYPRA